MPRCSFFCDMVIRMSDICPPAIRATIKINKPINLGKIVFVLRVFGAVFLSLLPLPVKAMRLMQGVAMPVGVFLMIALTSGTATAQPGCPGVCLTTKSLGTVAIKSAQFSKDLLLVVLPFSLLVYRETLGCLVRTARRSKGPFAALDESLSVYVLAEDGSKHSSVQLGYFRDTPQAFSLLFGSASGYSVSTSCSGQATTQ